MKLAAKKSGGTFAVSMSNIEGENWRSSIVDVRTLRKEIEMKRTLLILGLALSSAAFAQMRGHDMGGMQGGQGAGSMQGMQMGQPGNALADREVRKVNKEARKLTIKHGSIQNLDMAAKTVVYQIMDTSMLERVKVGDKVKFSAEKVGGALTVTRIEQAK